MDKLFQRLRNTKSLDDSKNRLEELPLHEPSASEAHEFEVARMEHKNPHPVGVSVFRSCGRNSRKENIEIGGVSIILTQSNTSFISIMDLKKSSEIKIFFVNETSILVHDNSFLIKNSSDEQYDLMPDILRRFRDKTAVCKCVKWLKNEFIDFFPDIQIDG